MKVVAAALALLAACGGGGGADDDDGDDDAPPPPECDIGAPAELTAGPGAPVGDSTGFDELAECGTIAGNVVLTADVTGVDGNCFNIAADGITIDGNGHTVTTSGYAVFVDGHTDVTIRNLVTDADVYLYGGATSACTVENCTLGGILVRGGDDHVIANNELSFFAVVVETDPDPALRLTFRGNHVIATSTDPVAFYGARDAPCPETNFVIEDNIFENSSGPSDVPNVLRMGCSRGNAFRRNLMRGTEDAVGWYLRDDVSDTVFEQNTLWTNRGEALRMASGNVDKPAPSRNTFRNNIFRSDAGQAAFVQISPIESTFEKNIFWGETTWLTGGTSNTYDRNTFVARSGPALTFDFDVTPGDTFVSNIFDSPGPETLAFDGFTFETYTGDYNVFHQGDGPVDFAGTGGLAAWQAASVAAGHPADAHSSELVPGFVDPASGDFRLGATTAAAGLGADGGDPGAYPTSCQ